MTARPHPSQFKIEPDPEARAARRIAAAHRLVEMGMELAEAAQRLALARMERQIAAAEAGEADANAGPASRRDDPVAGFERIARTVRLSLALAARLDGDEPVRRTRMRSDAAAELDIQREAQRREREAQDAAAQDERFRRNEAVIAVVTKALLLDGADEAELHEGVGEARERLNEGEWEYDLEERHFGAVVASLFEALEIKPDWSVWVEEPWAVEEARINALGSPYARGGAAWVKEDAQDEPVQEPVPADGSSP